MEKTRGKRVTAMPESLRAGDWRTIVWIALSFSLAFCAITGCDGMATVQNSQTVNIAIQVSPNQATLASGESKHFVATVSGTNNQSIVWSLGTRNAIASAQTTTSANLGTISQDGIYVAPAGLATSFIVDAIATSVADPTKSQAAPITITPVMLTVTPANATVEVGASLSFAATVTGLVNQDVIWAVNGIVGGDSTLGTISTRGVYIAPAADPGMELSITATSAVEKQLAGSATVSVSAPTLPPQQVNSFYGSGLQFDVLDNMQVAQGDADYRFRAMASGALRSFVWFDVFVKSGATRDCSGAGCECDGYGCGTGGTIEICIYPDDGTSSHLPTDPLTQQSTGLQLQPLACVSPSNLRSAPVIHTETFPNPPQLVEGTLYHLHWHNSDPDPAANYISIDNAFVWHPTTPRQPTVSDTDLAVLGIYNNGEKVIVYTSTTDTPLFQLNYADGTTQGRGYIDSWNDEPVDISGASKVREKFTVSGSNQTVTGVSVRVNRVSGISPLTITLETSNGSIIEQGEITAEHFPLGDALINDLSVNRNVTSVWGSYTFASPQILENGQSYQLILSTPADTRYQDYGIEKGVGYDFSGSTFFGDGYGQFSLDNGQTWTGFTQSDGTSTGSVNRTNADIQFYFTTQ